MSDVPALTTKDRNDADTEAFVVVSALDTGRGGGGRQRRSGWAPRCAAPLLAKNGGSRTTDIDGGTYIVIDPVSIAENQRGEVVETDYTHATGGGKPGAGYAAVVQPMSKPTMFHATQDPISSSSSSSPSLGTSDVIGVEQDEIVRRLTPLERDRLMGWPDDYTRFGVYDDGETREVAMTNRDRITGNGIVAGCTEWIGRRLLELDGDTLATEVKEALHE